MDFDVKWNESLKVPQNNQKWWIKFDFFVLAFYNNIDYKYRWEIQPTKKWLMRERENTTYMVTKFNNINSDECA
jgi:hypothetical protein